MLIQQTLEQILNIHKTHFLSGLIGGTADMGQEDDVVQMEQFRCDFRFVFIGIKSGGPEPAAGQGFHLDNRTPSHVDQDGRFFLNSSLWREIRFGTAALTVA